MQNKTISKPEKILVLSTAKWQKIFILSVIVFFVMAFFTGTENNQTTKAIFMLGQVVTLVACAILTFFVLAPFKSKPSSILVAFLSLIPLLNIILYLFTITSSSRFIKNHGFTVGIVGANKKNKRMGF